MTPIIWTPLSRQVAGLYLACATPYMGMRGGGSALADMLTSIAPLPQLPRLPEMCSILLDELRASPRGDGRLQSSYDALPLFALNLALTAPSDPRMAAFRLTGRTPAETAMNLRHAITSRDMGVGRLTSLLWTAVAPP